MVSPRVLAAMARPLVGHLDPYFLELLDRVQADLRSVFGTKNAFTLPISGTGSAGMETCFANLIEEGDEIVVGVAGVFGNRMCDVASRLGAKVERVEVEWGQVLSPAAMGEAIGRLAKPKLVAFVHAETSTGALQPVEEIAALAQEAGALVLLDTVTSLAGCPVTLDAWGVDACYSGTQKCLSCPPGLSPVSFSDAAMQAVAARKTKPRSWYLDLSLLGSYFGEERVYHHTAPISMIYALAEALELVLEEGLEARFARHERNHQALIAAMSALGLEAAAAEGHRLWQLNSLRIPAGIDEASVRKRLLSAHGIEIGPGLGPLAGKVWRIGLMGESSQPANIRRLILALEAELAQAGAANIQAGQALAAAESVWSRQ